VSAGEGDADPSLLPPFAPVRCWFCGEPEVIELAEMWGHQFMWETCCTSLHESLCQQVADDPAWGRELLRRLGAEAFAGHRLRRVADDDSGGLVLDWQLRVRPVAFAAARAFVGQYHAHCRPPVTWRYGYAALNGTTLLGVVMAGNPVARAFMGRGIVEVNRLCIRRDLPRALAWNCASLLYGTAAREAERRGFRRIITYSRADESGVSLVAAGWEREAVVRGRGWHSASRVRSNTNAYIDKVRWSRTFKQRAPPSAVRKQRGADAMSSWTLTPLVRDFGLGLSHD
jgi:hypothetical protein